MIVGSRQWLLVLLVWVVAVTAWPCTASGQSLAMSKDYPVKRINDDTGRNVSSGTDQTVALTITGSDCRSTKLKMQFNLTVTGYDNSQILQAWAGRSADCAAEYTSSTAALTRACWQLEDSITVANGVATVEIAPSLLLGLGVPSQFAGNQRPLTESCDQPFTQNARLNITVYFLLINTEGKVATSTTQGMYFLLSGPTAPDIKQLISADQALELKWGALTGSTTELTYEFYCAPNEAGDGGCESSKLEALGSSGPATSGGSSGIGGGGGSGGATSTFDTGGGGTEGAIDSPSGTAGVAGSNVGTQGDTSGTSEDGAGGYGGAEAGEEVSAAGVAGQAVTRPGLEKYRCGKVPGKLNSQGFTDATLSNGQSYAVALAVRDSYGNVGTLSKYQCAKARPVTTFFEAYRYDGGEAGGGFCNLNAVPKRTSIPVSLGLLGACAWLRRRQRRIRRDAPQSND